MIQPAQPPRKHKPPAPIRYSARAALVSLVIAVGSLVAARVAVGMDAALAARTTLKLVFLASSTLAVTALLLWVLFSAVLAVFGRRDTEQHYDSSGEPY
jgi:hypothetical protein